MREKKKKTLNKPEVEGKCLSVVTVTCKNSMAVIIFNGEILKVFPLRSGLERDVQIATFIPHSIESPSQSN